MENKSSIGQMKETTRSKPFQKPSSMTPPIPSQQLGKHALHPARVSQVMMLLLHSVCFYCAYCILVLWEFESLLLCVAQCSTSCRAIQVMMLLLHSVCFYCAYCILVLWEFESLLLCVAQWFVVKIVGHGCEGEDLACN